MRIVFRAEAAEDVVIARDWYEDHRTGLGAEFVEELEQMVELISEMPEAFPKIREDVRRALLRRFPFAVYYRSTDGLIEVLACLHMRRQQDG